MAKQYARANDYRAVEKFLGNGAQTITLTRGGRQAFNKLALHEHRAKLESYVNGRGRVNVTKFADGRIFEGKPIGRGLWLVSKCRR